MEGIWENGCWGEFVGGKNVTGSSVVNGWGMNDLCELINIWNFGIIMTTTTSGKEEAILVLEQVILFGDQFISTLIIVSY